MYEGFPELRDSRPRSPGPGASLLLLPELTQSPGSGSSFESHFVFPIPYPSTFLPFSGIKSSEEGPRVATVFFHTPQTARQEPQSPSPAAIIIGKLRGDGLLSSGLGLLVLAS